MQDVSSTVLAPRLVVADDEEISLMLLQDGLRGMGFQTTGCGTGRDALLLALKQPPDCILLDDKMQGLDTFKTIRLIRLMEPIRTVPILLLSDAPSKETILKAIQTGANDCVSKDSSLHDINLRIQRAVRNQPPSPAPVYDDLKYFFHYDDKVLTLDIESDITVDSGRNLVELVRHLTGLMPMKMVLNLERVPEIVASGVGYLSDVKDTILNCGGTIALTQINMEKFPPNVRRFLEKYFQFESSASKGGMG